MRISHCTSHRQKGRFLGDVCKKTSYIGRCSGLQIAKQLASQEDIDEVIISEVVESVLGFLPTQVLRESQ